MPEIFALQSTVMSLIWFGMLGIMAFGFFDAAMRPAPVFPAAGKQTKQLWLIILGLAFVATFLLGPMSLLSLAGIVGAFVYLADVWPAVRTMGNRR